VKGKSHFAPANRPEKGGERRRERSFRQSDLPLREDVTEVAESGDAQGERRVGKKR